MATDRRGLVPQRPVSPVGLEPPFRLGDIVRLKHPDGPKRMMVVDAMPDQLVVVAYRLTINGKKTIQEWRLHPTLLRRVRDAW